MGSENPLAGAVTCAGQGADMSDPRRRDGVEHPRGLDWEQPATYVHVDLSRGTTYLYYRTGSRRTAQRWHKRSLWRSAPRLASLLPLLALEPYPTGPCRRLRFAGRRLTEPYGPAAGSLRRLVRRGTYCTTGMYHEDATVDDGESRDQ